MPLFRCLSERIIVSATSPNVGNKVLLVALFYSIMWCIICGVETVRNEQFLLNK